MHISLHTLRQSIAAIDNQISIWIYTMVALSSVIAGLAHPMTVDPSDSGVAPST